MKHKIFWKEVRRSIQHSLGRFLAILGIVALGAGFLAGLSATEPVMRRTGDQYFTDTNYMDIKIQSTLGLTEDDVEALRQVKGVRQVQPSYMLDLITTVSGMEGEKVVRFSGMPEKMNQLVLLDGRLPEAAGECVVNPGRVSASGVQVGDTLTVLEDGLQRREYKVVGLVNSAQYLSLTLGTTTKGNGSLNYIAFLPDEEFTSDVYTIAYVQADGVAELSAFSKEYESVVDELTERLERVGAQQAQQRYEQMLAEGQEELSKARQEYFEEKAKVDEELSDADTELSDHQKEISEGQQAIDQGEKAQEEGAAYLEQAWESYETSWARFEENRRQSYANLSENRQRLEEKAAKLQEAKEEWLRKGQELTEKDQQLTALEEQLQEVKAQLDATSATLEQERERLEEAYLTLQAMRPSMSEEDYEEALQEWQTQNELFFAKQTELAGQTRIWYDRTQEAEQQRAQLENAKSQYAAAGVDLEAQEQKLKEGQKTLQETEAAAQSQLWAAQQKLIAVKETLLEKEAALQQSKETIAQNKEELQEAEKEVEAGQKELEDAKAEAEKKLGDAWSQIEEGQAQLLDLPKAKWYVLDRQMDESFVSYAGDAERMGKIATVFPWLFFVVAALVSLTTMTRMVEEDRQLIGTYKALGLSGGQIIMKYLVYAGLASILGAVIGIGIGFQVLPRVVCEAYRTMYMLPETQVGFYGGKALIAGGAALICTLGATAAACLRCIKEKPARLMQPAAPKAGKRIWLEHLGFVWKRLSFIQKVTARNMFRYKKRLFMTVIGIAGCTGLLLTGFGLLDSVKDIVQNQFHEVDQYDGILGVKDEEKSRQKVEGSETLEDYLYVSSKTADVYSQDGVVSAFLFVPEDEESLTRFIRFQTRVSDEPVPFDENHIVLTEKLADRLNVQVGSVISLKDSTGMRVALTVGGITENYLRDYIYLPRQVYEGTLGFDLEYNQILFKCSSDAVREEMTGTEGISTVQLLDDIIEPVYKMIRSLNLVVVVLIVSAGLLAFIVLYNLTNINITERQREIATIKVLGFHPSEVSAYIYRETFMLTLIGCLVGLLVGIGMHQFVITTVEVDMVMFGRSIHGLSFLWSALITVLFSLFVNGVMHFKLKKIDMVESLKSVD